MKVKNSKYSIPIKFWWAFARQNIEYLLEDTGKRFLYKAEKDILTTVADFSEDMLSRVNEEYARTREAEIAQALEMTCLSDIKGVPGIIASFVFFVEEIRLHFRWNIIDNSVMEYGEPKSEFVEAIGHVERTLFQHNLVEFMHNLFRCRLKWLDSGEGESRIIIKNLLKLLYGNGTSVLVTVRDEGLWSWKYLHCGGDPDNGVVYDVRDMHRDEWYEAIFYKRDEVVEEGENTVNFRVHFLNWKKKWDEVFGVSDLSDRVVARGTHTNGSHKRVHWKLGRKWKGKTKFFSHAFERWLTCLSKKQEEDILEAIPALSKGLINFEDVAFIVGGPVDFVRTIIANLNLQLINRSFLHRDVPFFWDRLFEHWCQIKSEENA